MRLQYLLDEHVTYALVRALRRRDVSLTVWCIGDSGAPPRNTPDQAILEWCEDHEFILITNNRSTMPVHLAAHLRRGRHMPGIFMLNASLSVGDTIDELLDAADIWLNHEYRDQIRYLPLP